MTIGEFIQKWSKVQLGERSAAQQHFLELCELFGHPKPADADPSGEWYTFEKGVAKHDGGKGWADVWKKGFFGWEYKGKHKDLAAAYNQLLQYREALENPPLLVVCDMDRLIVHTNFTNRAAIVHDIPLAELGNPRNVEIVRNVFFEPNKLEPGVTRQTITTEAASHLAEIAQSMRSRGLDALSVARFLDRVVFCLFAEDVGLLPEELFSRAVEKSNREPKRFARLLGQLFEAMAHGGDFGLDAIRHFNGDLFADGTVLELTAEEIASILAATRRDWSEVDPSIFGTLFERGLDPDKRSQLGAHYTSREDIEAVVDPVVMQPLRREWEKVRQKVSELLAKSKTSGKSAAKRARTQAETELRAFLTRLREVKVLDPACGSGNFLYVALQKLKDLEKEVGVYADACGIGGFLPGVGPWQLYGIETNSYAFDLAQTTVWIGWLQWVRTNGYGLVNDPILQPLTGFKCMDAILDLSDPANPKEPEWPAVDFIVGNPPFLGGSRILDELGREYQQRLWKVYSGRVKGSADLCCYWFEKARAQIKQKHARRAGLLATQAIRGGVNREILDTIGKDGQIFFAIGDREWCLDGAMVHVSMVGFDDGSEANRELDGKPVTVINSNLTSSTDVTKAKVISANAGICLIGPKKAGEFNIPFELAKDWLHSPNPHGRPNSDVLVPWVNGAALVSNRTEQWIIDATFTPSLEVFARYEHPFQHVLETVKPERDRNKEKRTRENWWLFKRIAPELRAALPKCGRYLTTVRHSKHRIFSWVEPIVVCDDGIYTFIRDDEEFFGVLQSRLHSVWALAQGTQVRDRESGFRYTPTTCFETFPFPHPTDPQRAAIAHAAVELDRLRSNWLNPPEWVRQEVLEFPGSVDGPWARYVHDANSQGIGTVRFPRQAPKDEQCARKLAKRTLTNLYNDRPAWLDMAHRKLDQAVFAAYGWEADMADEAILATLLELNRDRTIG